MSQAIDRRKRLLFRPFDLGKWFTIGFCAWLAQLGEAGFNMNYRMGSRRGGRFPSRMGTRAGIRDEQSLLDPAAGRRAALSSASRAGWCSLGSAAGASSCSFTAWRLKGGDQCPWHKFVREGNSLFVFRLVLGLTGMVSMLPLVALGIVVIVNDGTAGASLMWAAFCC